MDIKYVNAFITALIEISGMLGINSLTRTGLDKREKLKTENEVNVIIGLVGDIRGNVVLSLQENTAVNIASKMMGGMPVTEFDLMPKSALCELSNMVSGRSASELERMGVIASITPPTLIHGHNMISLISQVETLVVRFSTAEGMLELNIAMED
ncbi:chemotaxis protein CheX [Syntrophomonas curvata]